MKRYKFGEALIALVAVMAFTLASCSSGGSDGGESNSTENGADAGSSDTQTDSELSSYTYFYSSVSGLRSAYIFDNKGTADSKGTVYICAVSVPTDTTLEASLSKSIKHDYYTFIPSSYTFIEGTGAEEGEGFYFGLQSFSNIPYVAVQYDGKLYLVSDDIRTALEKGSDYYTAANFKTVKKDITDKFDSNKSYFTDNETDLYSAASLYKVDSTFIPN